MSPRLFLAITASSLSLGAFTAAVPVSAMAEASTARAAQALQKAEQELARGKTERAVRYAEKAVEAAPMSREARELLARTYLSDGRLSSAEAAYRDLLVLSPDDSSAALNLALVRAALGDGAEARSLLMATNLSAADKGLGLVLAGDVRGGAQLLESAARSDSADGRVRQNLGFAYAMAGDWRRARVIASQDLAPAAVHQRIGEWAQIARPRNSWDQVAYLLNIQPVEDAGMPAALALNRAAVAPPVAVAMAQPSIEASPELMAYAQPTAARPAIVPSVSVAPVAASSVVEGAVLAAVALSQPVIQPLPGTAPPVAVSRPAPRPSVAQAANVVQAGGEAKLIPASVTVKPRSTRFTSGGRYVVQLGAYVTPGAAERGWAKAAGRVDLSHAAVLTDKVTVRGRQFTRLSAGHFGSRAEAQTLCRTIQGRGGECFVREVKGDDEPRWAARAQERVASR